MGEQKVALEKSVADVDARFKSQLAVLDSESEGIAAVVSRMEAVPALQVNSIVCPPVLSRAAHSCALPPHFPSGVIVQVERRLRVGESCPEVINARDHIRRGRHFLTRGVRGRIPRVPQGRGEVRRVS